MKSSPNITPRNLHVYKGKYPMKVISFNVFPKHNGYQKDLSCVIKAVYQNIKSVK